jgi:hypothetical protein
VSDSVLIGRFNFRFQCQPGCTACCEQPGDVYLTAEDRDRIAADLDLTPVQFEQRYCETVDGDLRLSTPDAPACHFLVAGGCSIHHVKPLQCRTFPFWPEHVRVKSAWKGLSRYCPGVGVGEILPIDQIRGPANECAQAFEDVEG